MIKYLLVLLLAGCAHNAYNGPYLYLFHKGDKVKMSEECVSFNYFDRVCEDTGVITGYSDDKSRCYPNLNYSVEFRSSKHYSYTVENLCASDLLLLKAE